MSSPAASSAPPLKDSPAASTPSTSPASATSLAGAPQPFNSPPLLSTLRLYIGATKGSAETSTLGAATPAASSSGGGGAAASVAPVSGDDDGERSGLCHRFFVALVVRC